MRSPEAESLEKRMSPFHGFYWSPSDEHHAEDWAALRASGANAVIIPWHAVTTALLEQIRAHGITVGIDVALFAGTALRDAFPGSAPIDEQGAPMEPDDWYVPICPNDERIRAHHLSNLVVLLECHGASLDGIWLDFIRYPMRWEVAQPRLVQSCFCDRCLSGFLGEPGRVFTTEERRAATHTMLAEQRDSWIAWKCRRIAGFVAEIAALVRSRRPNLRLGLFSLPWRLTDHAGAIRTIVSQDIALLGDIVDAISPMVYHRLCHRDVAWIAEIVRDARERSHASIIPVVQSLDLPEPLPADEFTRALNAAMTVSDQGVMIFDLRSVACSRAKVAEVGDAFRRI
jgi:hypothetical protein